MVIENKTMLYFLWNFIKFAFRKNLNFHTACFRKKYSIPFKQYYLSTFGSLYLSSRLDSRESPSQIHISVSQINFFASQMNFSASQMRFSTFIVLCFDRLFLIIILFPELTLSYFILIIYIVSILLEYYSNC